MTRNRLLALGGVAAATGWLLRNRDRARSTGRRAARRAEQRLHYAEGRWQGLQYRLRGERPDADVPDLVLADRIRSSLGPLEKRLDLPHVHVMVEDHVALLHGSVGSIGDRLRIEDAIALVPGVRGVESYLHVGMLPGDTRPSTGRAQRPPSDARRALVAAAAAAGADELAVPAVRAVLAGFCDRLPDDERDQVLTHLPEDVRELARPPRRTGETAAPLRTVEQLLQTVSQRTAGLRADEVRPVVEAVLGELRQLVPEETADVAAVLPPELRALWEQVGQPTEV